MNERHLKKLLKVANEAYPDGIIERIRKGEQEVGDGLGTFIANEIKAVADGTTPQEITESVISALEVADQELFDVINALRQIKHRPTKCQGPRKKVKDFTVSWVRKGTKVYKATSEEAAEQHFSLDPNAPDEEQTTDVSTQKGGKL